MTIYRINKYLRLKPFDTSTAQGRSDERHRLALLAMSANFISRAISSLVMVFSVSLTLPYLGAERFGVWTTIASLAGMLTFLDLGVGNALTNKVADAASKGNEEHLADTISGGLGFLTILAFVMGGALYALAGVVPWNALIKVGTLPLQAEIESTIRTFSILFAVTLFAGGVQRVFHGLQKGFEAHLAAIIGSLISLGALSWCARVEAGVPLLLLSAMGGGIVANLLLLLVLLKRGLFRRKKIGSNIRLETPRLVKVGGLFFLLQMGTMVGWEADSLIISSTLGAASVAAFNVTQRLFMFVSQPLYVMNAPLWPAYADASSRGERDFIKATLARSMLVTFLLALAGSLVLSLAGEFVIKVWTGGVVYPPASLVGAFAVWTVFECVGNAFAMFLNGTGVIRQQVVVAGLFIALALPLKFVFVTHFGVTGVVVATVVSYLASTVFVYSIIFRTDILGKLK